ncbi:MAG: hypothetical protein ACM3MK_08960 [Chitinophagales bacterium]
MGLSVPAFIKGLNELTLHNNASMIMQHMYQVKENAMSTGEESFIIFTAGSDRYILKSQDKIKFYYLQPGIKVVGTNFPADPARKYVVGRSACCFVCTGAPTQGGTVVLEDQLGHRLYIPVTPCLGSIRISHDPPEDWITWQKKYK